MAVIASLISGETVSQVTGKEIVKNSQTTQVSEIIDAQVVSGPSNEIVASELTQSKSQEKSQTRE